MSYIVEKSVNSMLHSLIGAQVPNTSTNKSKHVNTNTCNISLGIQTFVEKLESAVKISKQEEEEYVFKEYQNWLKKVSTQQVKFGAIADVLCRGLIAYSRGHRRFNFHIHAIKLTQCDSVYEQKIGSLYLTRTLSPGADIAVLLVNSLQVHLKSGNYLQIACGLCLIPLIARIEVTPLLIKLLIGCLKSQHVYIRKRAASMVLVLCSAQSDKEFLYSSFAPSLSELTRDTEPSVVIAAILSMSEIVQNSESLKDNMDVRNDLGKGCAIVILQVLKGKMPESYNFKNTIAPLVLVQMLRALNNLGHKAWRPSLEIKETLRLVLSQIITDRSLGQCMSIIEAIHTTAAISGDQELISLCLSAAMKFIQSSDINYKYVGIKALTQIFPKVKDLVGQKHIKSVMECLYNCNPNLEKKSLKLLMAMVGPQNYQDLCTAILEYAVQMKNKQTKLEVHEFLNTVVRDFEVDPQWCLTLLPIIVISGADSSVLTSSMVQIISKDIICKASSPTLRTTCQDIITHFLNADSVKLKTLSLSASLLSALIRSTAVLSPIALYTNFYNILKRICDFTSYDKEIIDLLVLCGVYELNFLPESESILQMYSEKVDFMSSLKVRNALDLLKDTAVTKKLFQRQTQILQQNSTDLSFSFTDKFISKSNKNATLYAPPELSEQMIRRTEREQSLHTLTDSSFSSSIPVENISYKLTPASSMADASLAGSPKLVWTKDGRRPVEMSFEVTSADVSLAAEVDTDSVELANEAEEDCDINESCNESRKLDLMGKFLKGLKLSE